jgi:cytochrome c oxidase subunit 2
MIWTVVPACVLAVIIILGLKKWNDATSDAKKESIRIELFSKQFDWTARYSGGDNTLGRTDYKLILGNNELGLMTAATIDSSIMAMRQGAGGILDIKKLLNNRDTVLTDSLTSVLRKDLGSKERLLRLLTQMKSTHNASLDKHVYDDIVQKDTLYLCVNKPYEFSFRSKDVIHSAYFPHFRTQMNTVPGYGTRMKFTPNKTTEEMRTIKNLPTFNYVLMCNKICGGAHYKMKLMVVVLAEAEYNAWMKSKASKNFKATYFPAPAAPAALEAPAKDTVKNAMN